MDLRCIRCAARLDEDSGCTDGCGFAGRWIGDVPLLVEGPDRHLARRAHSLSREIRGLSLQLRSLESASVARRDLVEGLSARRGLLDGTLERLLGQVAPRALLEVDPPEPHTYPDLTAYFARDWQEPSSRELAPALDASRSAVTSSRERIVVLGAGAGRLAHELAQGGHEVLAVDSDPALADWHQRLRDGFRLPLVQTRSVACAGERVHWVDVGPVETSAEYVVADALQLPLGSGAVDLVVGVFFTDAVSVGPLVTELSRILDDGGRYLHHGPLHFHDGDLREHLTLDEVVDAFRTRGFEVGQIEETQSVHLGPPASEVEQRFPVWTFTATRVRSEGRGQIVLDSRLRRVGSLRFRTEGEIGGDAHRTWLNVAGDRWLEVAPVVRALLEALDGSRTLLEIQETLDAELSSTELVEVASVLEGQGLVEGSDS